MVGGGIAGSSTALALAKTGRKVVVLEQNRLTSGSTWHAAGLIAQLKHSEAMMAMAKYSRDFYASLESEGELPVGWHQTGSLGISRGQVHWKQLQRAVQLLKDVGIEHRVLSDKESVLAVHPLLGGIMDCDDFTGGIHTPTDGIVNPSDACMAVVTLARRAGATFVENCGVEEFIFDSANRRDVRSISGVRTRSGETINCGAVMVACGQWTKQLASKAGVVVPTAIVPHEYAVFDRVEGSSNTLPVVRDYMNKIYIKPEVGGFAVGAFEHPHKDMPEQVAARNAQGFVPADAADELYEESFDKVGDGLDAAMALIPPLAETGIKQWVHGPDTHSCDHDPIMGRAESTTNLYVATGFNSQGIQTGPGVGVAMANWIESGNPSKGPFEGIDFSPCDIRRFHPNSVNDNAWSTARALEGYAKEFGEHPPLEQWETGRGVRFSPLHVQTAADGALFGSLGSAGWERPLHYRDASQLEAAGTSNETLWEEERLSFDYRGCEWLESVAREHRACRESVALFDMSSFGKLEVRGPRAEELLEWCATSMIGASPGGAVLYTQMLNDNAGIESDLTIVRLPGDKGFYLVTGAATCTRDADLLRQAANSLGISDSQVEITEISDDFAVLGLMGPKARQLLAHLTAGPEALSNEAFPFSTMQELQLGLQTGETCNVRALRVSYAGELGWELHVPRHMAVPVYEALHQCALFDADIGELPMAGYRALLECLRIEKGYVHFGHDVTPRDTPLEAGLGFVSAGKLKAGIPFKGRDALEKQKAAGVRRRLVSFKAQDPNVSLWGHEGIYRNGVRVGYLTSGGIGFSSNDGNAIGMGYVQATQDVSKVSKKWVTDGDYHLEVEGKLYPATVHWGCLWDPRGERAKA